MRPIKFIKMKKLVKDKPSEQEVMVLVSKIETWREDTYNTDWAGKKTWWHVKTISGEMFFIYRKDFEKVLEQLTT